jgi:thiamine pyrophosphokinase
LRGGNRLAICYARGMGALHRSPRIRFKGTRAKQGRVGILALNGVQQRELRAADEWARGAGRAVFRIAVDGGLRAWRRLGVPCDLYAGDADSSTPPADAEAAVYSRDKVFSDLSGALGEARRRGLRVAVVAGVTGGRLDHEWANLQELAAHAPHFAGLLAPTPRGWVVVTSGGVTVETRVGRTFSLFAVGGPARVGLRGARWVLRDTRLDPGSRGLSNVSGTRLILSVSAGSACLVFPDR